MTAKREAELETEVRLLREQLASLERIIVSHAAVQVGPQYLMPGAAPQPWWWNGITWCNTAITSSLDNVTTSNALSPGA